MFTFLKQWHVRVLIDLINTDRPHAILFFIGNLIIFLSLFWFIRIQAVLPLKVEQLEKMRIESANLREDYEFENYFRVSQTSKLLGSGSINHLLMTGSELALEATRLSKELFIKSYEGLSQEVQRDIYTYTVETLSASAKLKSKRDDLIIRLARFDADLNYQERILDICKIGLIIGIILSIYGFVLWARIAFFKLNSLPINQNN